MLQSWLTHLAPIDLVAATLDVALGLGAAGWLVFTKLRSAHHRGPNGPSK